MKKLFYSTVCAAAVLLSGCSDTELAHVGSNTQNAIGFHVVTSIRDKGKGLEIW